jgi:hypothetical protein
MTSNDIQQGNLALGEIIADFLCFLDTEEGAVNDEHFESNMLVADLLMQSLGLEILEIDNSGVMTVKLDIGINMGDLTD